MSAAECGPSSRRFSPRRIAQVQRLRAWERNASGRRAELGRAISGCYLLTASANPYPLRRIGLVPGELRGKYDFDLLGLVAIALAAGSPGVAIRRRDLAALLGCHWQTIVNATVRLEKQGYLERQVNFELQAEGRHRQQVNLYKPGLVLRTLWHEARRMGIARAKGTKVVSRQIRSGSGSEKQEAFAQAHAIHLARTTAPDPESEGMEWAPEGAHVCEGRKCRHYTCVDARREWLRRESDRRFGRSNTQQPSRAPGGARPAQIQDPPPNERKACSDGLSHPPRVSSDPLTYPQLLGAPIEPPPEWLAFVAKLERGHP